MTLQEFSYCAHSSIAEMVDIVGDIHTIVDHDDAPHDGYKIFRREGLLLERAIESKPFIQFVASSLSQPITPWIEKEGMYKCPCIVWCWWLTWPQLTIELDQRILFVLDQRVAFHRSPDIRPFRICIQVSKQTEDLIILTIADSAEKCSNRDFPLAIYFY